jgi:hypothetical protein
VTVFSKDHVWWGEERVLMLASWEKGVAGCEVLLFTFSLL